jgi:hypothetical protein
LQTHLCTAAFFAAVVQQEFVEIKYNSCCGLEEEEDPEVGGVGDQSLAVLL